MMPCSTCTTHRRSSPCSEAANAIRPADPNPPASAQIPISVSPEPVSAAISAPKMAPRASAMKIAATIRPTSRRRRSVGPSMSQKPSADDATTGPNIRARISVNASTPATDAHGSRPRAATQPSVSQTATTCWARTIEEITMAPISTMLKTMT